MQMIWRMNWHAHLAAAITAFALSIAPAQAGPMQDFERELRAAYADYRTALFRTNTNDKAASTAAIENMGSNWQALTAKWLPAPPPQYSEDPNFKPTLEKVVSILGVARTETQAGKLTEAHDTLEKIRDELGNLRRRNGLVVFSDRMNGYHEQMEKILLGKYDGFDARGVSDLRDDAAVLAHLLEEIAANPPADRDGGYEQALAGVRKSVEDLRTALRTGDVSSIKAAIKMLKPPYARMFLNYG